MSDTDSLLAQNARRILNEALSAPIGIQVLIEAPGMTSPALRAKQVLYRFKKEDRVFAHLQIRLHPTDPDNRLWVLNATENVGLEDPDLNDQEPFPEHGPDPIDIDLDDDL